MKKTALILILSYQILHANGFQSLRLDVDARSAGMGQAVTALVAGGSSGFANVAAIPALNGRELVFSSQNWIQGVTTRYLGFVSSNQQSGWGGQILYTEIPELEHRLTNTEDPLSTFSSYEVMAGISYGRRFGQHLYAGAQIKTLYEKMYVHDASALGADLSVYWQSQQDGLAIGAAVQNMGQSSKMVNERIALPLLFRFGVLVPVHTGVGSFRVAVDGVQERDTKFHILGGCEYAYRNQLFLRAGYQTNYEVRDFTAGAGLAWKSYALDYSYIPFSSGLGSASLLTFRIRQFF